MNEDRKPLVRPALWRIRVAGSSDDWTHVYDEELAVKASRHDYEVQPLHLGTDLIEAYDEGYAAAIRMVAEGE